LATTVSACSAPRPKPASRARSFGGVSPGPGAAQVLERRFVDMQLIHLVLREIADAQLRRRRDLPLQRMKFARQQLGERRFSLAVPAQ
jgi:hypothetical protein